MCIFTALDIQEQKRDTIPTSTPSAHNLWVRILKWGGGRGNIARIGSMKSTNKWEEPSGWCFLQFIRKSGQLSAEWCDSKQLLSPSSIQDLIPEEVWKQRTRVDTATIHLDFYFCQPNYFCIPRTPPGVPRPRDIWIFLLALTSNAIHIGFVKDNFSMPPQSLEWNELRRSGYILIDQNYWDCQVCIAYFCIWYTGFSN